jgi:hypothetical protein
MASIHRRAMCARMYTCMRVYISVYHVQIQTCACMHICLVLLQQPACNYVYMDVHMYTKCILHVNIYICIYYLCIHMNTCSIYIYTHAYMYRYFWSCFQHLVYVDMFVHTCIHKPNPAHPCVYVCVLSSVHMTVCVCMCVGIHAIYIHTYIYVYIYIYIYRLIPRSSSSHGRFYMYTCNIYMYVCIYIYI